jgi:hypothetical protein
VDAQQPARRSARRRRPYGSYWQDVVLAQVRMARHDLELLAANGHHLDDAAGERINELLNRAESAAAYGRKGLPSRLRGGPVHKAFVNLHTALVLTAHHVPDGQLEERLLPALAKLRATLSASEPRRQAVERAVAPDGPSRLRRAALVTSLHWSYTAADAQYARLRSFRNVLVALCVALVALWIVLAVVGARVPAAMALCFSPAANGSGGVCPTGTASTPLDTVLILLLGSVGGALAAVVAVRQLQDTQAPYAVPLALAALKLPLGGLTALLGLILIHGKFVPGLSDLDTPGQILAYAVVLGYAQQLLTGLLDRQGQLILSRVPHKKEIDAPDTDRPRSETPHPPAPRAPRLPEAPSSPAVPPAPRPGTARRVTRRGAASRTRARAASRGEQTSPATGRVSAGVR